MTRARDVSRFGVPSGSTANRPASPIVGQEYYDTDLGYLIIWSGSVWYGVGVLPTVPTSVIATDTPSGRAYNNGAASVAFTGTTGTSYTVTSSPGSFTATGASSPIVVTGLQSSTSYTYTVTATNPYGTSAASSSSSGVTATTAPQAPTIGTATGGNAQASVTFTAGATGGSAITSYTVTSNPGGFTGTGSSSPITVTGLTNGTSYTFTVTATNANGTSAASSASNSVTPASAPATQTYGYAYSSGISPNLRKFTFTTETWANASASYISGYGGGDAGVISNKGFNIYFAGGNGGSYNGIIKLSMSNDSTSALSATTPTSGFSGGGNSNFGTAGYFKALYPNTGGTMTANWIYKITFSTDAGSTLSATMGTPLAFQYSASNSGTAGYVMGGSPDQGGTRLTRIEKLTYSSETNSTLGATIGYGVAGSPQDISNIGTAGYGFGGYTGAPDTNQISKVNYSNDTASTLSATLGAASRAGGGFSITGTYGYYINGTGSDSYTQRLVFSNDTMSNLGVSSLGTTDYSSGSV